MRYATKKAAREVIEREMPGTCYAEGMLRMDIMKNMLRSDGYGEREVNVIIASLVLAGAKFKVEV